jgi:hypothetical protein
VGVITNNAYAQEEFMPFLSADGKVVFYSQGSGVGSDLYLPSVVNSQSIELGLNDCNADNSDPIPIGTSSVIFSSTHGDAFYRLYLGDIVRGKVWSMNKCGVKEAQKHQLDATYTKKVN